MPLYAHTGNILLDRRYGAVIHDIACDEDRNRRLRAIANALSRAGRHVYFVPYGASDALGDMGYALAAEEIVTDPRDVAWIDHGSGSTCTQAGLLAGLLAMGHPARVAGVDVDAQAARIRADVCRIGREAATLLGCGARWDDTRVEVIGHWSGPAYGVADATTEEAARLAAQLEGPALDPVYSGKGTAGLIGLARDGRFAHGGPVVRIRTGGGPGIFADPETIARAAKLAIPASPVPGIFHG
ncbi:MAG: pyridoxal-phosphate dependent enzyme [Acetobacteraceae bacterium]